MPIEIIAMNTLNEIVQYFNDFADSHKQIKSFRYDNAQEIDSSADEIDGVILWMTWRPSFWTNAVPTMSFSFFIMDRVDVETNNFQEVQSDTLSIATDLLSEINNSSEAFGLAKNTGIPVEPFKERFSSMYAGCIIDIDINLPNGLDSCQVPNE